MPVKSQRRSLPSMLLILTWWSVCAMLIIVQHSGFRVMDGKIAGSVDQVDSSRVQFGAVYGFMPWFRIVKEAGLVIGYAA